MRILALSPHTDDAEIGAGASLVRWMEEGHQVYVYAFSTGDITKGASFREFANSMETLGIAKYDLGTFSCHYFPRQRQKIIETIIGLRDVWNPDVVLCPSTFDCHQDHETVCNEAIRACKQHCSIYGYDMPWNAVNGAAPTKFVNVQPDHIVSKFEALRCYDSQVARPMMDEFFLRGLLRVRGVQGGMEYAEAFEVIRERE